MKISELIELPEYKEWLATRPQAIQEMAKEYPIGLYTDGKRKFFVVGYGERADGSANLLVNIQEFQSEYTDVVCPRCVEELTRLDETELLN